MARIDAAAAYVFPLGALCSSNSLRLARRKNRELDPVLRQHLESFGIDRGFRQPHSFRLAAKARLEIANTPLYLRDFVSPVGQRQNHVVVTLRNRRAVSRKAFLTQLVGLKNRFINLAAL